MLRRVLAQAQIQRVLDEARRHHIIGSTHVSCKAAAILRCASNAGRAHLYYLHKSSSKCNQTSTSRGRTSQSFITRKPKYYYYSPFSLNLSQTKQQNAEFGKEINPHFWSVSLTKLAVRCDRSFRRIISFFPNLEIMRSSLYW